MGIVEEVEQACKTVLDSFLTNYSQLPYQYQIERNPETALEKGYAFTAGPADYVDGRAMGFTTMNHTFKLTLIDTYLNKDGDENSRTVMHEQYNLLQESLKELQKSKLALPTQDHRILLITGLSLDDPQFLEENGVVLTAANFNIQYRYRNN